MADAKPAEKPAAAAPAKKPNILVIALVGLNVAILAAVGAYFFLTSGAQAASEGASHEAADDEEGDDEGEDEDEEAADDEEGDEEEDEDEERAVGPMVEFESMVVNLAGPSADHYLKVTFQLEVRGEEQLEEVESHMVIYRDQVLSYLVTLEVSQVTGAEGGALLRTELLALARHVFGRRNIRGIYFTELLVQ